MGDGIEYVRNKYEEGRYVNFNKGLKGKVVDWELLEEGTWINVIEKIKDRKGNIWYRYLYWGQENGYWLIRARSALVIPEWQLSDFIKAQSKLLEKKA